MPTPVNTLLSPPPTSATQLLKPKEAAIGSTDFSSQLKDAQQAHDKPAPAKADGVKSVRREAGKSTRTSTKSKTAAKGVRKRASAEDASDDTVVETTADAEKVAAADGSPGDSNDSPADGEKAKSAPEKTANQSVPSADPSSAVTPAFVRQTPPASVIALRNARLAEMREHSGVMTPFTGGVKVESTGAQETPAGEPGAETSADGFPTQGKTTDTTETASPDAGVEALPDGSVAPVAAKTVTKGAAAQTAADAVISAANLVGDAGSLAPPATPDVAVTDDSNVAIEAIGSLLSTPVNSQHSPALKSAAVDTAAPSPREAQFAEANHASIVSALRTNLLPHGGTMEIRLDPPELGALQVSVEMRNGTINATFQTSNDDATRLLGHSLGQLKTALESQGVTVDKIQVQQAPRDQKAQGDSSQQQQRDDSQARQDQQRDQQRREMLQRMWQRISGAPMPVDLVA